MNAYDQGYSDILQSLGMTKEAYVYTGAAGRLLQGVGRFGKDFGRHFKNIMIGSPFKAVEQLQTGRAFGPGGLIRAGFYPGKGLMGLGVGGLMYGLPAYEAFQAIKRDDPNKAEQLGRILGGTLAGLGTWRAFGILGSMAADPIGRTIGGALGRGYSSMKGQQPAPLPRPGYRRSYMSPRRYSAWGPQR